MGVSRRSGAARSYLRGEERQAAGAPYVLAVPKARPRHSEVERDSGWPSHALAPLLPRVPKMDSSRMFASCKEATRRGEECIDYRDSPAARSPRALVR